MGITDNDASGVFFIRRASVTLKVFFQPNMSVSVEPYKCKPENERLCHSVARVQNTLAQLHIDANKGASPYLLLLSFFDRKGWEVEIPSST